MQVLRPLGNIFPATKHPELLVGLAQPDDSAVYKIDETRALISTMDFFPPVVDDPYAFGAIAAANALSDVYAMGGEPLMAINLVAFPDGLDHAILSEILRGGAEKVREAGAVVSGGHTVSDKEPKYGLSVTGMIHPERIVTKGGARVGDRLILTKALGTGVITTALKNDKAKDEHISQAITSMSRLNRDAAWAAQSVGVHAMTDITGYSLIGHSYEVAMASEVSLAIDYEKLLWLPGAVDYANQEIFPGGTWRNQDYFKRWVRFDGVFDDNVEGLLYDPQTSGGLLMAVASDRADELLDLIVKQGDRDACIIGEVIQADDPIVVRK